MNDIFCPHCNKAFKVDESGYAHILKQVRDSEFDKQIQERLKLADREKLDAVELAKEKTISEMREAFTPKETEIATLKAQIDGSEVKQKLAIKEPTLEQISRKGLYSSSIDFLDLSVRARNCLKDISSIGELVELSNADLAKIRNMGRKTLHEIEAKLGAFISKSNNESISPVKNSSDQRFCDYARSLACGIGKNIIPSHASLDRWKSIIRSNNYLEIPIINVCTLAGAKWPQRNLQRKNPYSEMVVGELIDFSTEELLEKKAFGKKKVIEYYKALAFLASGLWHENLNLDPVAKVESILRNFPGLTKIEREILELRVGRDGPPQTLEEIGSQKKVTRERIRQLEKSALRKIRTDSNLEAFNQFLTDREKEIWNLLGGVNGTINETAKFDELAECLPFDFRLSIQVYTGSKVSGERFPNVLRSFLMNRYKFAGGCWYNVPIDPTEIEVLIDLILRQFSEDLPFYSYEELVKELSDYKVEKIDYALSMTKDLKSYNEFWSIKSLTPRVRRTLNLLTILQEMNAASYPVNLGDISHEYSNKYEDDPCSPRDLNIVMSNYKRYFVKMGSVGWMLLNQSSSLKKPSKFNLKMNHLKIAKELRLIILHLDQMKMIGFQKMVLVLLKKQAVL